MEAEAEKKLAATLKSNAPYLRELSILAEIFDKAEPGRQLSPLNAITCLSIFAEGIGKLNNALGLLSFFGCKQVEIAESDMVVVSSLAQLNNSAVPLLRRIFDRQGDEWFSRDTVIEHGHNYARSWTEVVLQTAEQFFFVSRTLNIQEACRILFAGAYESGKVECHLELEVERAWKVLNAANESRPENEWPTITRVAAGLGINKGQVTRLVNGGHLRDNGQTGTPRRIDPASVLKYCEREGIAYNDT